MFKNVHFAIFALVSQHLRMHSRSFRCVVGDSHGSRLIVFLLFFVLDIDDLALDFDLVLELDFELALELDFALALALALALAPGLRILMRPPSAIFNSSHIVLPGVFLVARIIAMLFFL
jgi:hypothetical protein